MHPFWLLFEAIWRNMLPNRPIWGNWVIAWQLCLLSWGNLGLLQCSEQHGLTSCKCSCKANFSTVLCFARWFSKSGVCSKSRNSLWSLRVGDWLSLKECALVFPEWHFRWLWLFCWCLLIDSKWKGNPTMEVVFFSVISDSCQLRCWWSECHIFCWSSGTVCDLRLRTSQRSKPSSQFLHFPRGNLGSVCATQ